MILTQAPTVYDMVIDANANFDQSFQWTLPNGGLIDLTGYTAVLTIASDFYTNPNRTVFLTTQSTDLTPMITFPEPTAGVIRINIPAATTSLMTFKSAVFDLLLTAPDTEVTRLLQGPVDISPGVTDDRPG